MRPAATPSRLFIRGAYARGAGLTADDLARPIIAMAQTYSDFNAAVATSARSGMPSSGTSSGGLPRGFPTVSLGEI